jgi:DNA-binding transcriptional regulator LsrR (DeoR family)
MNEITVYNLSRAADELDISVTQVRRLLEDGRLEEVTNIASAHSRFVTAESVAAYKEQREEK